jgi:hypothetical protein
MRCYQVTARYAFIHHKAVLISTHIKPQNAKPFLAQASCSFGHGLKFSRFFSTKREAAAYVAHLKKVYAGRTVSEPAGGQLALF